MEVKKQDKVYRLMNGIPSEEKNDEKQHDVIDTYKYGVGNHSYIDSM